jgi:NSS family neurotransmitter:Na+ symporter
MERENFGSKFGAILATAGSAVGLGNIWRFPVETGKNGGAAFILIYIACILLLGLPLMLSEFVIGRHTQSNATGAYHRLAPGTPWKWVGRIGVFAGFIVLSYYAVVAGWTCKYAVMAIGNQFEGADPAQLKSQFQAFSSNPWEPLAYLILMIVLTHLVVVMGIKKGIERCANILMPALFIIIVVLVVCSVLLPGAGEGLTFLLKPDFSKVDGSVVLRALGQAFFSLSLGLGCLCTYASYFKRTTNLPKAAVSVITVDSLIALMAGFIIFPATSAAGMPLDSGTMGPELIFITLPHVFQQAFAGLPWLAYIFSVLFFLLLIIAALTSTISMHEIVTSYMKEEYHLSRPKAATIETVACVVIGVLCSLSFGVLGDVSLLGRTIFDFCDWIVCEFCMPIGGILISVFVGWYLKKKLVKDEITNGGTLHVPLFNVLIFILKYIAPVAILLIFLDQFGVFL